MHKFLFTILILTLFYGCDAFDYHPYDGKVSGQTKINATNIKRIETTLEGKTSFRFAFITDTQRRYTDTKEIVRSLNKRNDIDFVIHGGDISDFGATKEFMWMRDILNGLNVPYVTVIGNHDCLGNGEDVYEKIFGDLNYSFIAGNVKFLCLNTNALEYDYSRPVPDFNFIQKEQTADVDRFSKTIVIMHARPFSEQFNNNVANIFQEQIKKFKGLQFCVNGHAHELSIVDLFNDGVLYFGCPEAYGKDRGYFVFNVEPDGYEYELVNF